MRKHFLIFFVLFFHHFGNGRLKKAEKEGKKNDLESTAQSNGGFQVRPSSLMEQMSKKVKSLDNRSNVEQKGVTAKERESVPLEEMPTPERPARSVSRRTGPTTGNTEADVALLGNSPPRPTSPNERARAEFFKALQTKDQTS